MSLDNCINEDDDNRNMYVENIVGISDDYYDKRDLLMIIAKFIYSKEAKMSNADILVAYYMFFKEYDFNELKETLGWDKQKLYFHIRSVRSKLSNFLKNGYFRL